MRAIMLLLLPLLTAAGSAPIRPAQALAGRFYASFPDGTVDGSTYRGEDIVEIVAVDPRHAYVRLALDFYNGHECNLSGVAQDDGRGLTYRAPPDSVGKVCALTIWHEGRDLRWNDPDGGCQSYCGARGGFANGRIAWASRRPIRYLARLKASPEYKSALIAWKTGQPSPD